MEKIEENAEQENVDHKDVKEHELLRDEICREEVDENIKSIRTSRATRLD